MMTMVKRNAEKEVFSKNSDEFEKYIVQQRSKTTFNGIEVAAFSWYKKILGL